MAKTNMTFALLTGPPVRSTSYIDEAETVGRESSTSSPEPPFSNLALRLGNGNPALSQSYLNIIADSANNDNQEGSDAGSLCVGVANGGGYSTSEAGVAQSAAGASGETTINNGRLLVANSPDVVPETFTRKPVPISLDLCTQQRWRKDDEWSDCCEGSKFKHSHSRTKQKNVHCLETAV